jgi:hypothetical protein
VLRGAEADVPPAADMPAALRRNLTRRLQGTSPFKSGRRMCADRAFKLCIVFTKLINHTLHPMSRVCVRFVTVYKFAREVVSLLLP